MSHEQASTSSNSNSAPRAASRSMATLPRPLIDYCTNEWRDQSKYPSFPPSDLDESPYEKLLENVETVLEACLTIVKAPKFRRLFATVCTLVVLAAILWVKILGPWIAAERAVWNSLNDQFSARPASRFGNNIRPHFPDLIQVEKLDPKYLPRDSGDGRSKRLIFIGDIHGCQDALQRLLKKVDYRPETDHIIATGDIVNKGPDTVGVVDFLRRQGASSVRGNHEDRLLLMIDRADDSSFASEDPTRLEDASQPHGHFNTLEALAKGLNEGQVKYLRSFPVILDVGDIEGIGPVVAVHAGLVPGVPLEAQDPASVMNMRVIDLKSHVPSKAHHRKNSIPWYKLFNKYQRLLSMLSELKERKSSKHIPLQGMTVIYGHDSKQGLRLGKYTKGLDTGCVRGGKLTALVISRGGHQELEQVLCKDYTATLSSAV